MLVKETENVEGSEGTDVQIDSEMDGELAVDVIKSTKYWLNTLVQACNIHTTPKGINPTITCIILPPFYNLLVAHSSFAAKKATTDAKSANLNQILSLDSTQSPDSKWGSVM